MLVVPWRCTPTSTRDSLMRRVHGTRRRIMRRFKRFPFVLALTSRWRDAFAWCPIPRLVTAGDCSSKSVVTRFCFLFLFDENLSTERICSRSTFLSSKFTRKDYSAQDASMSCRRIDIGYDNEHVLRLANSKARALEAVDSTRTYLTLNVAWRMRVNNETVRSSLVWAADACRMETIACFIV
jgi:hypothetical protein